METISRVGANIKSDTYLYGCSLKPIQNEPYVKVLLTKYILASKLIKDLLHVPLLEDYDKARVDAVYKAKEFNKELIKELGYSDYDIRIMLSEAKIDNDDLSMFSKFTSMVQEKYNQIKGKFYA